MIQRDVSFSIPFEPGEGRKLGWTLKFQLDLDPKVLMVCLYWGDKATPTHVASCKVTELQAALDELAKLGGTK